MLSTISSAQEFEKVLFESTKSGKLAVIHFWAEWAPQCQQMNEVIVELTNDACLRNVLFYKIAAEALPDVTTNNGITSVPSFLFIRDGKVVVKTEGADVPSFTKTVRQQLANVLPPLKQPEAPPKENLKERLKRLTNSSMCILFMKGNPQEPKCGFSKQVINLLKEHNADFTSFDILTDEEVRQGLKEYSNWPTYPQLYVKGDLIGGIDILKELAESGEIDGILPHKEDLNQKLSALVSRSPLMVFMKGSPIQPKCGFSKTLVAMLNDTKIPYDTFDILEDEIVRQGLKTFSNWPTFPQVYVKGNFVGGLDVLKEMKEVGELESTLLGN